MAIVTCYDALKVLTGENVAQPQIPVQRDAPMFFGNVDGALNIDFRTPIILVTPFLLLSRKN